MPTPLKWTPELVQRFWGGVSQSPLGELSFSRHCADFVIDLAERYLDRETRILDFGAGDGDFLRAVIGRGYRAAGYEFSQGRALQQTGDELADNPAFLGLVYGEEPADPFDCLFLVEVIEHVLDDQIDETFNRIRQRLRPGALLVVTTPNDEDLGANGAYCPQCDSLFHRWQHVRSFSGDSLTEFLGTQGFTRKALHRVDFSGNGTYIEAMKELDGWAYWTRRQRKPGKRFRDLLMRMLGKQLPPEATAGDRLLELLSDPDGYRKRLRASAGDLCIGSENQLVYIGEYTGRPD